ncbi:Transcriptional regulatory protein walR [uncultured Roseburia sp.]|uniref:Stage 0 sporulation protein A homolog n=1 Tax=Brotonthovivens ammoniilytica TaxID=2981725 RepID=A0ABT2TN39_9FIRM|nr:VanR-ABDEGLN family response regulator transcription factor [Brotonthovivens ammoniilytica]MCU6763527.1 VanR-ABDEGLN family response regulator transcription factor [Brotonthovivens ammoniilytica]SCJ24012.1 Transcriptional regulatory protein walR [uncultured Roseburia sp.]
MPDILVVDDEHAIANLIELYLKNENFTVYKFHNGTDALNCIQTTHLDLAILDVMLPDIDGFTICQKIREQYTFPVLMLTAKDGEIDQINGFTLGADDYITKPFRPLELVARVKAHLRRANHYDAAASQTKSSELSIRGLCINTASHAYTLNEQPLSLTPTEFDILRILCENLGQVVSSEELFQKVWGEKYYKNAVNTVMVHIRHLRAKMHDSAERPKYIKTVWGVGYKIDET